MFLNLLNDEEKKYYLAIAMRIVNADGKFSSEEIQMINSIRLEMGLVNETELPVGSIEVLAEPFKSERSKKIVLLEGTLLAYVDGKFSGSEKKILRALALIFEIPEETALVIEDWVKKFVDLQKEVKNIINI